MKYQSLLFFASLVFLFLLMSSQTSPQLNEVKKPRSSLDLSGDDMHPDSLYISIEPFEESLAATLQYLNIKPIRKFTVRSKYRLVTNSFVTILKLPENDFGTEENIELISTKTISSDETLIIGKQQGLDFNGPGDIYPVYLPLTIDRRMNFIQNNDSLYLSFGSKILVPLDEEASISSYSLPKEPLSFTRPKNSIINLFSTKLKVKDRLEKESSYDYVLLISAALYDPENKEAFNKTRNSPEFLNSAKEFHSKKKYKAVPLQGI